MKKETKNKFSRFLQTAVASATIVFGLAGFNTINAASIDPTVTIDKKAQWINIEKGIGKITLTENETLGESVELADYLIIYDTSGSMPIVTVNNYEPGTYQVDISEVHNIGCKNPNHYSVLKPGQSEINPDWRNADHYDNNGTPDDRSDDIYLNYSSSVYEKYNWKGDKIQTFYLSSPKDFMYSRANGCYNTSDTSQEMLNKFIDKVESYDKNSRFAYVSFAGKVVEYSTFTSGDIVKEYINGCTQYNGTNYGPALQKADEILDTYTGDKDVKVIFITDGINDDKNNALNCYNTLKENHPDVEIYAVTADYVAGENDDIKKIGDKYIYVDSDNVDETVQNFIDYSLNKETVKVTNKVYTDVVSNYFEIIRTPQYPIGAYTTFSDNKIVWNIPENDTDGEASYRTEIFIKLKDEYRIASTDRYYPTNKDNELKLGAQLNYTVAGGDNDGQIKNISKETAYLPYGMQTATVLKNWVDYENKYNTRPESIEVNLTKNGNVVASKTMTGATASFEGYTRENGEIKVYSLLYDNNSNRLEDQYSIVENSVGNYDSVLNGNLISGFVLTNTLNMPAQLEIKYVDTEGNILLPTKTFDGKVGQEYETIGPDIYGFRLTETPENSKGTYTPEKTTVTYVYENVATSLVVEHIYIKDDSVLYQETLRGLIGDIVNTSSKELEGYTLVESPETERYVLERGVRYVKYYYAKVNNVVSKYVDEVSGKEISDKITQKVNQDSEYYTEELDIDSYTCTGNSGNTYGTVDEEDVEVTYYYRKNTNGINIKYVDQVTGEEIADSYHITGLEDEKYTTKEEEISGYELVKTPKNATGKFKVVNDDVVYEYRKKSKLIVHHIDASTEKEIADTVVKEYKEGEDYEGFPALIDGYTLVESPKNTVGTMGRENVEMTFVYKRISAGLVVKYVDEYTNDILDEDLFNGNVGDEIELKEKEFENYILTSRPEESVNLEVEALEKIFYYKKKATIKVKGIVEQTGEVLYEETEEGLEGNKYETEPKKQEGYDLVKTPKNKNGEFGKDKDDVIYVYSKIAGDLVVNYIDVDTDKILDIYSISGYVNDEYLTEKKSFENYDYLYVEGKEKGELKSEKQDVNYYYERVKGNVVVVYEHRDGAVLLEKEMEGKVGTAFEVEEQTFENYVIVHRPDKTNGEYINGTIELKYILDDPKGQIIVNFVDTDGNPIAATIYDEKYVGEHFYLEAPEIEGYTRVSDPVIDTKFDEGEITIDIVYEKIPDPVIDPAPQEPEQPGNPDTPDNPSEKPDVDIEAVEINPNPSASNNPSADKGVTTNKPSEIAENPDTADINVIVYLVVFIAWTAVFVKQLIRKDENQKAVIKIK